MGFKGMRRAIDLTQIDEWFSIEVTESGDYSEAGIKCFYEGVPLIVGIIRAKREVAGPRLAT
jgi:hypothetical protein